MWEFCCLASKKYFFYFDFCSLLTTKGIGISTLIGAHVLSSAACKLYPSTPMLILPRMAAVLKGGLPKDFLAFDCGIFAQKPHMRAAEFYKYAEHKQKSPLWKGYFWCFFLLWIDNPFKITGGDGRGWFTFPPAMTSKGLTSGSVTQFETRPRQVALLAEPRHSRRLHHSEGESETRGRRLP